MGGVRKQVSLMILSWSYLWRHSSVMVLASIRILNNVIITMALIFVQLIALQNLLVIKFWGSVLPKPYWFAK
jgi:hypothetical protein